MVHDDQPDRSEYKDDSGKHTYLVGGRELVAGDHGNYYPPFVKYGCCGYAHSCLLFGFFALENAHVTFYAHLYCNLSSDVMRGSKFGLD